MTGMPAFGPTHTDDMIWAIVAFTKKLPNMTAEEYQKMGSESDAMDQDQENTNKNEAHNHSQGTEEHHH